MRRSCCKCHNRLATRPGCVRVRADRIAARHTASSCLFVVPCQRFALLLFLCWRADGPHATLAKHPWDGRRLFWPSPPVPPWPEWILSLANQAVCTTVPSLCKTHMMPPNMSPSRITARECWMSETKGPRWQHMATWTTRQLARPMTWSQLQSTFQTSVTQWRCSRHEWAGATAFYTDGSIGAR